MKTKLILCLLCLILFSCLQKKAPPPLKLKAYDHNPILTPGEPGSWDDLFVVLPQVIRHDNMFYLFYTGSNINGVTAIGLATSNDGFNFTKYERNPVLAPDGNGPDAFGVGAGVLMRQDSVWVIYYNCSEIVVWGPGPNIGSAIAKELTGPWIKDDKPVLTIASKGEWDAEYVFPGSVVLLDDGSYRMYYSGGADIASHDNFFIGMASSPDGITWKKYNDPATDQHPFAESDPVLTDSDDGEWDDANIFTAFVYKDSDCYKMYYYGSRFINRFEVSQFGFATSLDGIHWEKYPGNPVYKIEDDPYSYSYRRNRIVEGEDFKKLINLEGPWLVFLDTVCLMYYDYTPGVGEIGMATATYK